jgi:integrase
MQRKLSNIAIKHAKPYSTGKPRKLSDGGGLYLLINKTGKYWRYNYRYLKKQKTLALGVYPEITLSTARERHREARKQRVNGIDPAAYKKVQFKNKQMAANHSFEAIANEWHGKFSPNWSEPYRDKTIRLLNNHVYPYIGQRPISEIDSPNILEMCNRLIERNILYTAHSAKQLSGRVFRYAIATGRAKHDPTPNLKGALPTPQTIHMPAITDPIKVGGLMRAIEGYEGQAVTCAALRLLPLVFTRPGELRKAEWSEIDFEKAIWIIPSQKMKKRRQHYVPLSKQSLCILKNIQPLTGRWKYVFPSIRKKSLPMCASTINAAFRCMGYSKDELMAHGLRTTASSLLNEKGYNPDAIEAQLSHSDSNQVRAAYNRSQYWNERVTMMQDWADYLDELRNSTV